MKRSIKLSAINKYPVKSLKAVSLLSASIDDFGIVNDRRWMLVDENGKFITQREYPVMGIISVEEHDEFLRFNHAGALLLDVPVDAFTFSVKVSVWRDEVHALKAESKVNEWFSRILGIKAALVYMPTSAFRQVDRVFADYDQRVSFADGFPFLLISEASLADLNSRLTIPVSMSRFRPNLVVSGCEAFAEDQWKKIRIGHIEFELVKPCSRCIMTTIDEGSLKYGKEPLKTLAGYRRNEFGVCFGQNSVHQNTGLLNVGDSIELIA